MYKFLDAVTELGVSVVAIHGNHDHPDDRTPNRISWIDRDINSMVWGPNDGILNIHGLKIKAINWLPAIKVRALLAEMDSNHPVDILVMHQSCEGMVPQIANPEVTIAQLAGKARYVAIGDIHITKTIQVPEIPGESAGTLIVSSGSIERNSDSESPDKYVVVSKILPGSKDLPTIELVPIKNKEWTAFSIEDEASILALMSEVEKNPQRVFSVSAKSSVMPMLSGIQKKIKEMGGVFVPSIHGSTSKGAIPVPGAKIANTDLDINDAIDQHFADNPEMAVIAKDLWNSANTNTMQSIIAQAVIKLAEDTFKIQKQDKNDSQESGTTKLVST
jgi:hypothetical protein